MTCERSSAGKSAHGMSRRHALGALLAMPFALRASAAGTGYEPVPDSGARVIDPGPEPLRLALVADCQYADVDAAKPTSGRQYLHSPRKLADAVATLARSKPHAAIHLGDLIDRDFENFAVVKPVFDAFACPRFHVAGNHDYSVADADKARVRATLGIPEPGWLEASAPGWRFLFPDSNEISLFRRPAGTPEHDAALAEHRRISGLKTHARFAQTYNGGLGETQRAWLDRRLTLAASESRRVVIFCHQPVVPENAHSLWDTPEVLEILAKHPHVVAWINGHDHAGGYRKIGATHHLNLKGMVETRDNTFALATFLPGKIGIAGFGREPSRTLEF